MSDLLVGGRIPRGTRRLLIKTLDRETAERLRQRGLRLVWWAGWSSRTCPVVMTGRDGRLYDVRPDGTVKLDVVSDLGYYRHQKARTRGVRLARYRGPLTGSYETAYSLVGYYDHARGDCSFRVDVIDQSDAETWLPLGSREQSLGLYPSFEEAEEAGAAWVRSQW